MPNLFIAGCSVSDYTKVDKVWGEFLSEKIQNDYVHLAAACGSNYRMWRLIASKIINREITKNDTVIFQYTTLERNEFWSPIKDQFPLYLRENYKNSGSTIRFKVDSYSFGYNSIETKLLKLYTRFINLEYEEEKFVNNHMMIQCLAKEFNIKNLYFVTLSPYGLSNMPLIPSYENNHIVLPHIFKKKENCLPRDRSHLSDHGHQLLANTVFEELTK